MPMAPARRAPRQDLPPPGLGLLAMEFRAPFEAGALLPAWPALQRAPAGDGHTVLVFPGLTASDVTTMPLRRYLKSRGYDSLGWSQGFNFGPRAGVLERAMEDLAQAFRTSGRKVSLIGWSLGGVYARELAKEMPDCVRCVVTLGSPFAGPPKSTNAWRVYELTSGRDIHKEHDAYELPSLPRSRPPASTRAATASSRGAGACSKPIIRRAENIEVVASHLGIGVNPSAWWAVADRLAQEEGRWRPFDRTGLFGLKGLIYPDPNRA